MKISDNYYAQKLDLTPPVANKNNLMDQSLSLFNYPNPFNPETTISFFTTEDAENTELNIYNLKGQHIRSFKIHPDKIGTKFKINTVVWDGNDDSGKHVASGIYLVRLKAGEKINSKKILLLK